MAIRPHLRLPAPRPDERWKTKQRNMPRVSRPGVATQRERFDALFEQLRAALSSPDGIAALRADPNGLAPNRGLVFITAAPIERVHRAIQKTGLNFVIEAAERFQPDNLFFYGDDVGRQLDGRLYVTMPNVAALRALLALYDRYRTETKFKFGTTAIRDLFDLLIEIRPWSAAERVSDRTAQSISDVLRDAPDGRVRLEIELYPGVTRAQRTEIVAALGADATLLREARIAEIQYHGLLVEVSPQAAEAIANRAADGPSTHDGIFLIEPHSVVQASPHVTPSMETADVQERPAPSRPPRAALLDGLPISGHPLLQGRLEIADPDNAAAQIPVAERKHGTAIASLIVHGELAANEPPLDSKLLVRPVLTRVSPPDFNNSRFEQFDADKLTVEIVHAALEEFFGDSPDPRAKQVFVVNISLGDRNRPAGAGSPVSGWARLLDWWSSKTGLLFIVSTGNEDADLSLEDFANFTEADGATTSAMTNAALKGLVSARAMRPVLSPAEAVNALTVGAAHAEATEVGTLASGLRDPLAIAGAPSLITRCGPGAAANAMKPDVLMPGGRTLASVRSRTGSPALKWSPAVLLSGQQSAATPRVPAQPFPIARSHGSSNSAALATRLAVRAVDNTIGDGRAFPQGLTRRQAALMAKCLIAHAADWNEAGRLAFQLLRRPAPATTTQERAAVADLFGYGLVAVTRALNSTDQRVTLIDVGAIKKNEGLVYQLAPPPALSPSAERRTISATVAWFTPVQPTRRFYRQAELFVDDVHNNGFALGCAPLSAQPTDTVACRGTVWSQRFDGVSAIAHDEDERLKFRVSCRETYPGALSSKDRIPYALAITIEVGAGVALPLYDQIMDAIRTDTRVRTRVTA